MRFSFLLASMALLASPATVCAAPPDPLPKVAPMRVTIVRSDEANCEPSCAEWISAEGKITAGTPAEFRKALKQMGARSLPVFIHSPGGLIPAALEVGRMLRARKLTVAVTGTFLETCLPGDRTCAARQKAGEPLGAPAPYNARCASACSFILAGGIERLVSSVSYVGVHRATAFRTQVRVIRQYRVTWRLVGGRKVETSRTLVSEKVVSRQTSKVEAPDGVNRDVAKYITEMGVRPSLLELIAQTPSADIHWLTAGELISTGIVTARTDGADFVRAAHAMARAIRQRALAAAQALAAPKPNGSAASILPKTALSPPLSAAVEAAAPAAADAPADARSVSRLGPIEGRDIDLEFRFLKDTRNDAVQVLARASADGEAIATLPLKAYLGLPGGQTYAAVNARADQPAAPLEVSIPRIEFCELLFEPSAWLSLEARTATGGMAEAFLQTRLFKRGELKASGLCPLWTQSGAQN